MVEKIFEYGRIIDISPMIHDGIGVFPGDQVYQRKVSLDFEKGHHLLLSNITTTLHVGAHTDAPNHYDPAGGGIDQCSLDEYIGVCDVVRVEKAKGNRIFPEDLPPLVDFAPRVLLATHSFPDPDHWNSDFNACSPELIHYLAENGVRLIGIDTPSIDPEQSKHLESHAAVKQRKMRILEGIVLSHVAPGRYTLIALPLRLKDADASPVRAILLR